MAAAAKPEAPPERALGSLLGRSYLRTLVFVILLLAAAPFGAAFLFGVLGGLVLEMLVYVAQAILSLKKGVN